MDAYEKLASGIILQTVKDYRVTRKKIRKNSDSQDTQTKIESIRRFFLSPWFAALSEAAGSYIIRKLDGEG